MLCPPTDFLFPYFRKDLTCLSVGLKMTGQVFLCPVNLPIDGLLQIAVSCVVSGYYFDFSALKGINISI